MRSATVLCLAYLGVLSSVGAADVAGTVPKVTVASNGAPHIMTALTNAPTLTIELADGASSEFARAGHLRRGSVHRLSRRSVSLREQEVR